MASQYKDTSQAVDVHAQGRAEDEEEIHPSDLEVNFSDIAKQFSLLGWIGFGGPAAHIGLFQKRLVEKLRWVTSGVFMELFALAQCLPGPTSTQVSFAMGTVRQGTFGGLLSGALFQAPGAIMMTCVGIAAAHTLTNPPPYLRAIIAGLSAISVAMIASAAKGLLTKMCGTNLLALIATFSAAAAVFCNPPWLFPALIVGGGITTIIHNFMLPENKRTGAGAAPPPRPQATSSVEAPLLEGAPRDDGLKSLGVSMSVGAVLASLWLVVLIAVTVLSNTTTYDHRKDATLLDLFNVFYRCGSLVYGGGQVVLPILMNDLVKYECVEGRVPECQEDPVNSWMTAEQFYAGLGIVQAMPGPLFNFSAYLGALFASKFGYPLVLGSAVAWLGLFGPGVALMFAAMPYWTHVRRFPLYRYALPGLNAAGVGLILSSVFKMTISIYGLSPFPTTTLCLGLCAFTAVDTMKVFEPVVVLGGIGLGLAAYAAKLS